MSIDPQIDDEALVRAVREGAHGAAELLVRRFSSQVYRIAWGFVRNDADADDITQDAFAQVFRRIDTFRGESRLKSWIYRVTVNAALMRLRKARSRPELSLDAVEAHEIDGLLNDNPLLRHDDTPGEQLTRSELRDRIRAAVQELDEPYRVVFLLRDVEGLSAEETSEVLDLSVAAVKSRLHRARLFLRGALEGYVTREGRG